MLYKAQIFKRSLVVVLALFVMTNPALSQQGSKDPISYSIEAPETIKIGDQFIITTVFNIQSGWYIYAPITMNMALGKIPTKVSFKIPDGFKKIDGLELPNGFLDTYQGEAIKMSQRFEVAKKILPGSYNIKANITYQTCNDNICYPPVWEQVDIVITVM